MAVGLRSLEAVRRKTWSLQEQADTAEAWAERLQRELDKERALQEQGDDRPNMYGQNCKVNISSIHLLTSFEILLSDSIIANRITFPIVLSW
uniref:Uncharacterized protein n=1 Tax=Anolis carolinensis TaxID=28377 RepID=A0A803TWA6_ANOCA